MLTGISLGALCQTSLAATYYVDRASTGGSCSDSYSTSQNSTARPWCSIGRATNAVSPGDIAIVRAGDYSSEGLITFSSGGNSQNQVIFRSETSRTARVQGFNTRNASYLRIEGFEITSSSVQDAITINSNDVEIIDNYMHDFEHRGIECSSANNILISGNRLYRMGAGMNISGNNWVVENNEIERLVRTAGWDADYSRFFGTNHVIRNNYFHGTLSSEIGVSHTDCFQTYTSNNMSARNMLLENNICTGFFSQGIIARGSGTLLSDFTIRNNIFANDANDRGSWGVMTENVANVVVVNNVFANIRWYGVGLTGASDNAVVLNNIFYNSGDARVYYSEGSNFTGNYNIQFGGRTGHVGSQDQVGVDPDFTNPSNFNFTLQSGSPAIDAGTDTSAYGVIADRNGNSRPAGSRYDIGAHEYNSTSPPVLYGDVSGNGSISAYDASLTAQDAVSLIQLAADQIIRADVTGNGSVSATDASWIALRSIDSSVVFPVE